MLARGAQFYPLIAQSGGHSAGDHGLELRPFSLITHPMQQVATRSHLFKRVQIATLVTDARQSKANELLRNISQAIAVTAHALFWRIGTSPAHFIEDVKGIVGHATV